LKFFISLFYWIIILPAIKLVLFPISLTIWIFTVLFDKNLRLVQFIANIWGASYIWLNPFLSVEVHGRDNIEPGKTYIATPNHSSLLDIPAVHSIFMHFKWISKASLKKVPFIGWNMVLNKTIFISRTDPKSQFDMMRKCEENLDIGNSIMIFPEGTRHRGKELGRFRDGAFLLAKKKKNDVLPIAISYSHDSVIKGFVFKHKTKIIVEVLKPIAFDEYKKTRELRDAVKNQIEESVNSTFA
jgi:1-acyl-sn-glycerol-3-phosphate acyltransferase